MTINERIRYFRRKLKYTQADVAKMLDMKISTYSQMERKGNITCETLIKLTHILKTDALTLLYGENYEEESNVNPQEITAEPIDLSGVQPLVADDVYEKAAVIAMRRFPHEKKQELYNFFLNEFKIINELKIHK